MRRSRETNFLIEGDVFYGITLGADWTAEHEWGIKTTQEAFGIDAQDESKLGIERYIMTKLPASINLLEKGRRKIKEVLLYFNAHGSILEEAKNYLLKDNYPNKEYFNYKYLNSWQEPQEVASAWDEKSFAIRVFSQEEITKIRELKEAFIAGDIAIWVGGKTFFGGGGMHLIIASKMPQLYKDQLYKDHVEQKKLNDAVKQLTIIQELKDAGKKYFALQPSFFKNENGEEYLKFFLNPLNPMGQNIYNSGWFTIEELRQWIQGAGPILKVFEDLKER